MSETTKPPDPLDRHGGRKNLLYAVWGVRPVDYPYWADIGCTEVWQGEDEPAKLPPEGASSAMEHLDAAFRAGMKARMSTGLLRVIQKTIVNHPGFGGWIAHPDEIDNKVIQFKELEHAPRNRATLTEEYVKLVQATHALKGPRGRFDVIGTYGHNARHLSSQPFLLDCYSKTLRSLDAWAMDEYLGAMANGPVEAGVGLNSFASIAYLWDQTLGSMQALSGPLKCPWWLFVETGDIFNKGEGKHGATTEYVGFAVKYAHDRGAEGVCFFPLKVRGDFRFNVTTPETATMLKWLTKANLIELRRPTVKPLRMTLAASLHMSDGSVWTGIGPAADMKPQ